MAVVRLSTIVTCVSSQGTFTTIWFEPFNWTAYVLLVVVVIVWGASVWTALLYNFTNQRFELVATEYVVFSQGILTTICQSLLYWIP